MTKSATQLDREIAETLLRQKGRLAYSQAHARIGDSGNFRLGPDGARRAAVKAGLSPEDQEAFMKGWLDAREEHMLDRARYGRRAYVPLPLPEFGLPDED